MFPDILALYFVVGNDGLLLTRKRGYASLISTGLVRTDVRVRRCDGYGIVCNWHSAQTVGEK